MSPNMVFYNEFEEEIFRENVAGFDESGIKGLLAQWGITEQTPKFKRTIDTTEFCLGWRQTGGCDPNGPREEDGDRGCRSSISGGSSGYCECTQGKRYSVPCGHEEFKCEIMCAELVSGAELSAPPTPSSDEL
eukprot:NODE_3587_length_949_cov_49.168889_g3296_i0.p1 GENE.NODE_3587_length_949_cov_49.168889_g3296_i0~~NODE_3587_length_949_cov_49.168889_g3296_i0.p1  ORF type:complete len:133 (+),score=24.89 NODE_3587_length_949_cov_49.168889_g3296_i0:146-544(+)